jgi:hypothetical protein
MGRDPIDIVSNEHEIMEYYQPSNVAFSRLDPPDFDVYLAFIWT